jgi:hypothetical protein
MAENSKPLSLETKPVFAPVVNPIQPGDILSVKKGPSNWSNYARLYEPDAIQEAYDLVVKSPDKYRILRQCFPLRNGS